MARTADQTRPGQHDIFQGGPFTGIVFDFDGVILQSTAIKSEAFAALFADEPEHVPAIVALHEAHGGISRFRKFDWIYRDILGKPLDPLSRDALGARFEALVFERLCTCPFVPGAVETLQKLVKKYPLFICSGTPDAELKRIVQARDLTGFFQEVHGSPAEKPDILQDIARTLDCSPRALLFIGDAETDRLAAVAAGTAFTGIVPPGAAFPFQRPDLYSLESDVPEHPAFPVLADLHDLPDLLVH